MKKFLFIVMAVVLISANAFALELPDLEMSFYGQLHVSGFYVEQDRTLTGKAGVGDFNLTLHDYSRFGANFKMGDFTGVIELQPKGDADAFRRYFITYNIGEDIALTIGKDWTPSGYSTYFTQYAYSNNALWAYGTIYDMRLPQIRFDWEGFSIAVVSAGSALLNYDFMNNTAIANYTQDASFLPRFEVAYAKYGENYDYKIYAGYANYSIQFSTGGNWNDPLNSSINSYHAGIGGYYDFGPVYVSATVFAGQNMEIWGAFGDNINFKPVLNGNGLIFDPVLTIGGAAMVGVPILDNLKMTGGGGYMLGSHTSLKSGKPISQYSVFLNMPITVGKYLQIIPEVSYFEDTRDAAGEYAGAMLFAGVYFFAKF